jgi:hypothetical protein
VHAASASLHEVSLVGEPLEAGLAYGFLVTSDAALFAYKCTVRYNAEAQHGEQTVELQGPVGTVLTVVEKGALV